MAQKIGPSTFSLDYASMIKKVNKPVFLISGKYDFIIRPEEVEVLNKSFKIQNIMILPMADTFVLWMTQKIILQP